MTPKQILTLVPPNPQVRMLLGEGRRGEGLLRWSSFLLRQPTEEGLLLYNTLTLRLIHLPRELVPALEAPEGELRDWLRRKWFLVPVELDEHAVALELREILRAMEPPAEGIEKYTVLTTTACNARCFYCFEHGWEPRTMSPETADKAADYMLTHSRGIPFRIDWFGGEPLVNLRAIDRICQRLSDAGADFISHIVTNAYLFDPDVIARAASLWRLRMADVTLDGVGETYDRIKRYKTGGEGAFARVTENLRALAAAGVLVNIRMNFDLHNLEEIYRLADWLIGNLAGTPRITAYPIPLNEDPDDPSAWRSPELRARLNTVELELRDRLEAAGLRRTLPLPREPETHMCMADSGRMITILPEGQIGLCENYDHSGFIGSLDSPELDREAMEAARALRPEIPACADCPLYPGCIRLKLCPSQICHPQRRQIKEELRKRSMLTEWKLYQQRRKQG